MEWVDVCSSVELPEGGSKVSPLGIAVFRHQGRLYAVEDRCSHGTGRLSDGDIEDINPKVRLVPLHACSGAMCMHFQ